MIPYMDCAGSPPARLVRVFSRIGLKGKLNQRSLLDPWIRNQKTKHENSATTVHATNILETHTQPDPADTRLQAKSLIETASEPASAAGHDVISNSD